MDYKPSLFILFVVGFITTNLTLLPPAQASKCKALLNGPTEATSPATSSLVLTAGSNASEIQTIIRELTQLRLRSVSVSPHKEISTLPENPPLEGPSEIHWNSLFLEKVLELHRLYPPETVQRIAHSVQHQVKSQLALRPLPSPSVLPHQEAPLPRRKSLIQRLAPHLVTELNEHESAITSSAYSPDGTLILTTTSKGYLRLWKIQGLTLSPWKTFRISTNSIFSAAFSPDSKNVLLIPAAEHEHGIHLYDAQTGNLLKKIRPATGEFNAVLYSPSGKTIISTNSNGAVDFWDGTTFAYLKTFRSPIKSSVLTAALSPDEKTLLTIDTSPAVTLWNTETGTIQNVFVEHSETVNGVTFNKTTRTIASASNDKTVLIWRFEPIKALLTLEGHGEGVVRVEFSPDGNLIMTVSESGEVFLWDSTAGHLLAKLNTPNEFISSAHFSPDGTTALISGWGGTSYFWKLYQPVELDEEI